MHGKVGSAVTCIIADRLHDGTWQAVVGDSRGCISFYSHSAQTGKLCLEINESTFQPVLFTQDPLFCRLTPVTCLLAVSLECAGVGPDVDFIVCCLGSRLVFVRERRIALTLELPGHAYSVCSGMFSVNRPRQIIIACEDNCLYIIDDFKVYPHVY